MFNRLLVGFVVLSGASALAQDVVVSSTNSPYVLTASSTANSITLQSGGTLQIDGAATVTQPIVVVSGATLVINHPNALDNLNVNATVAGTLVINPRSPGSRRR